MKKYIIRKRIAENANCPAAYLLDCKTHGAHPRTGIANHGEIFDTLEEANKDLQRIAMNDADEDCNYTFNYHSWPLFCASCARTNHTARTNPDGTRYYNDGDVTTYEVEQITMDDDGTYWTDDDCHEVTELN